LLLSFWLPWLPILPSIVHGSCNGLQLQLIECIESLKCEVKKKMMHESVTGDGTKVTVKGREKKFCIVVMFFTADQLQNFNFSQFTVEEISGVESFCSNP